MSHILTINKGQYNEFSYSLTLRRESPKLEYSITQFIPVFSVWQALMAKCMYFRGIYTDGLGLFDKNMFGHGDEIELVLYRDSDDDNKLIKKFYVSELRDAIQTPNAKRKQMTVIALTKHGIVNKDSPITKAYKGRIHEIASKIYKDVLTVEPKELAQFQETEGDHEIIFVKDRPFAALDKCLQRAVASDNNYRDNLFFTYEDFEGIKFKNTRKMKEEAEVFIYKHYPTKSRTESQDDYYRIQHYVQRGTSDTKKLHDEGVLDNEIVLFDPIKRKLTCKTFKYEDEKESIMLLGKHSGFDPSNIRKPRGQEGSQSTRNSSSHTMFGCSEEGYGRIEWRDVKYGPSLAQKNLLSQNSMSIKIKGNPDIKPGDILQMVSAAKYQNNPVDGSGAKNKEDRRLTGSYLVSAVRHDLAEGRAFDTIVDLVKDSYELDVMETDQ